MINIKRKRGRPRHDEPREINEFDLTLIEEFQRRPALYDRTHPQYRNREFLEPLWEEIARLLGYKVALLKERMIQLRNRYNLEKRRVEQLQEQYSDPDITSQWLLYDNLSFLGEHIKSRRSMSQPMVQIHPRTESNSSPDIDQQGSALVNGCATADPLQSLAVLPTKTSTSNNTAVATHNEATTNENDCETSRTQVSRRQNYSDCENGCSQSFMNIGNEKFKAFGQFLTSSLMEMNEKDALVLVEKFTSDIVKSMLVEVNK